MKMGTKLVKHPRTDMDVRTLLTLYQNVQPDGRLIPHQDIEAALRESRTSARYKTVVKHWRRALFQEQRIFLDGRSAEGHGFKVLTPDEMIRYSNREVRAAGRRLRRAIAVAATPTDGEIVDPHTRAYRARLLSGAEQLLGTHGRLMREIGVTLRPMPQLPRATRA